MNHTDNCRAEEYEVDLMKLAGSVFRKGWLVAAASVVGAVLTLVVTCFFLKPEYEASVLFYVDNGADAGITASDISASRELVDSCVVILKTGQTLEEVKAYAQGDRTCREMDDMISAEAVNGTQLLRVTVKSPDPREAEKIADAVANVLLERISEIIAGAVVKIVDASDAASGPDFSRYARNTLIGFLLGFALSCGTIVIYSLWDTTICTVADIARCCSYPVLAVLPNAGTEEACRLLRTKVQHLFAGENRSHILGVTGVVHREGKSQAASGLACSLSSLGKKVVLVNCDPSCLEGAADSGLSDYLRGQCSLESLLRQCREKSGTGEVSILPAGPDGNTPELLHSRKMEDLLAELSKRYDYVILDMPPVGTDWDAVALAGKTEGVLLVVQGSQCSRDALADAVREFAFMDAKILGIVLSHTAASGGTSGRLRFGREKNKKVCQAEEQSKLL